MSAIKTINFLVFFLLSVSVFAQSKGLYSTHRLMADTYQTSFKPVHYTLDLKIFKFLNKEQNLSIYNKSTGMYDNYFAKGDTYIYSDSGIFFKNRYNFLTKPFSGSNSLMEGNSLIQNTYFMIDDDSSYRVRDSFNPYGSSSVGQAVLAGFLGLIFK